MVDRKVTGPITIERQWFIDSRQGNIKDDYYFEKKLGSGGYGAVYLAKHKKTGKGRERSVTQYLFSVIAYQSVYVSLEKLPTGSNLEEGEKTDSRFCFDLAHFG
jgi:hypothetical protein